ncbi:MAG TPA: YdjY domain-containing protein [Planctomycetota bacterium]|nr:YdjY domain-containing protein [Planctomycetota bacterium]
MKRITIASLIVFFLAGHALAGENIAAQPPPEAPAKDPIRIDRKKKVIEIDGKICLDEGALELLACTEGGKEYESLISLQGEPWKIHVALLLLGLKPGGGAASQGDATLPTGDTVIIEVQWEQDGKTIRKRCEDLLFDSKQQKTMEHVEWVFVGSRFEKDENGNEFYMANRDKSVVTVFHDPYTIIDIPLETGADDTVYVASKQHVPPKETPIVLIITPGTKKTAAEAPPKQKKPEKK